MANIVVWGAIIIVCAAILGWWAYSTQHPRLSASNIRPGTMVGSDWNRLGTADKWTVIDFWPTTRDTCKARDAVLASNVDAFYAQPKNAQVHIDSALTLVLAQAGCLVDIH